MRQNLFHSLIKHTLSCDQRIFGIFRIHLFKSRHLALGLIDTGFPFCLCILYNLVALSFCLRNFFISVLIGIIDGSFLSLLGVFHVFKGIQYLCGRRKGVLNGNIYHCKTDILFHHTVCKFFLDFWLDFRFSCGNYIVYIVGSHRIADIGLGQHF